MSGNLMVRAFRNENVKKDEGKEGDINMNKRFFLILMLIMALALVACGGDDEEPTEVAAAEETVAEEPVAEEKPELKALWFAWQPCEALGELAAMYDE